MPICFKELQLCLPIADSVLTSVTAYPGRSAEVTDMVILLALTDLMELIPDEALR